MATAINNNIPGLHFPAWEQMPVISPVISGAGTCMVSDNKRYLYILFSTTSFWRFDTWTGVPEQLNNPTGGTVGTGTCITYVSTVGNVFNNEPHGSIYALITSGTGSPVFNRYDIYTNQWFNLNVTNLPATFGTDGSLIYQDPFLNNYETYGGSYITTVTASADVAIGANTIPVTALTKAIPSGAVLNFGTKDNPKFVAVMAAAAVNATSLSISAAGSQILTGESALFFDHIFLIGNAATQMYRFQITTSTWSTTGLTGSAMPVITSAVGAGCHINWTPGSGIVSGNSTISLLDNLIIARGAGSSTFYRYDTINNTMNAITYYPSAETLTTGSHYCVQINNNKSSNLIFCKEITGRFFKLNPNNSRKEPIAQQDIASSGAALVGNRIAIINHKGINIIYYLLSTSQIFLRSAITL